MADRAAALNGWLAPVPGDGAPCGADVEYDDDFLELLRAAQGKPAAQFTAGEPPNWLLVREKAEALLERTRDLRLAVYWTRAGVNLDGFGALAPGLSLVAGLLDHFWSHLHPLPDAQDGDPYARINALAMLCHAEGLCGDLRQAVVFSLRGTGEVRVRTIAIAHGKLNARPDEPAYGKEQLAQMVADAVAQDPALADLPRAALSAAQALAATLADRFDVDAAPDLRPLLELIQMVQGVMPAPVPPPAGIGTALAPAPVAAVSAAPGPLIEVRSRDDALRAIDLVCEFLERTEPSNPAQILLRRTRRLINQDFLQLIKELAPDALPEASRVLGVNPDSVASR